MTDETDYVDVNEWLDERQLYKEAIEQFGAANQVVVAMEEASELVQALAKIIRYSDDEQELEKLRDHIAEEMADVLIMCNQLGIIFNIESEVVTWMDKKLDRLAKRLEEEKKDDIQTTPISDGSDQ